MSAATMDPLPPIPAEQDALGGYFGLELPQTAEGTYHPGALGFQSARAAFLALLRAGRPDRVWMPWFVCDSLMEPLRQCGIPVERYALTPEFRPVRRPPLASGDWFVTINYFGLCDAAREQLEDGCPPAQLVCDNAQAFFCPPQGHLATLYSPRKFFGVPDGGYLVSDLSAAVAFEGHDTESHRRATHLIKRVALGAEAGYADFLEAEESLCGQPPRRMSALTQMLMASIPYDAVIARRRENFRLLHQHLAPHNQLEWRLRDDQVPLCYPFLPRRSGLREALAQGRIYVARYWPDLLEQADRLPPGERHWIAELLPLPIDQRCTPQRLMTQLIQPLLERLQA